ncbi:MAG: hypothetical protein ABJC61_00065 [Acidobacteriota bacterium]
MPDAARRPARTAASAVLSLVAALLGLAGLLDADQPMRPPSKITVCSPSRAFCATADPVGPVLSVFAGASSSPVWSMAEWHRQFFLADDGDHLVIGPEGLNLLPADTRLSDPLLVFRKRQTLVRVVTVGELFPSLSSLPRTASHLAWGRATGISSHGQMIVELAGGRRVAFSAATGRREPEK